MRRLFNSYGLTRSDLLRLFCCQWIWILIVGTLCQFDVSTACKCCDNGTEVSLSQVIYDFILSNKAPLIIHAPWAHQWRCIWRKQPPLSHRFIAVWIISLFRRDITVWVCRCGVVGGGGEVITNHKTFGLKCLTLFVTTVSRTKSMNYYYYKRISFRKISFCSRSQNGYQTWELEMSRLKITYFHYFFLFRPFTDDYGRTLCWNKLHSSGFNSQIYAIKVKYFIKLIW